MAQQPAYVPLLIGLGVRTLSMEPANIPSIQEAIARVGISEAEGLAADVLGQISAEDDCQASQDRSAVRRGAGTAGGYSCLSRRGLLRAMVSICVMSFAAIFVLAMSGNAAQGPSAVLM